MTPPARRAIAPVLAALALAAGTGTARAGGSADPAPAQRPLDWSSVEIARIQRHGPWPQAIPRDPSNRASGDARAVALGQRLFFDARLSANGAVSCGTCHVPAQAWADGMPRGVGLDRLDRNTPSVINAGLGRWFAWDGRSDSLWSQALKALLDPREMGVSAAHVAGLMRSDPTLACLYEQAWRERPAAAASDDAVLVSAAKATAAFVETLASGRTAFDDFRAAVGRRDRPAALAYPVAAQRGLRLFVGRGNCYLCHVGPTFTNGEFHDVGVPFLLAPGRVDAGRHDGIKRLRADRFNLLGPWSDDASGAAATKTRHVEPQHANFGQFKTPSLRNVALTAPYMHDGRYATLREAVRHYSELNMERLHTHGEQLLRPLKLSDRELDDMVAFLETLTDPRAGQAPAASPVAASACPPLAR
jgi:cytochrome c peroxidase